jgi:hypothetical protein
MILLEYHHFVPDNKLMDYITGQETQAVELDEPDRLTSAEARGESNGFYSEEYDHDGDTGNLAEKAGIVYGYNDANHSHAVKHLDNTQKYWYDDNGTYPRPLP